jgi:hypothetical protein
MKSSAYLFGEKTAYDFAQGQRESTNVDDRRNEELLPEYPEYKPVPRERYIAVDAQRKKMITEQSKAWPWSRLPETAQYNEMKKQLDAEFPAHLDKQDKYYAKLNELISASAEAAKLNNARRHMGGPPATSHAAAVEKFVVDMPALEARQQAATAVRPDTPQRYTDPRFYQTPKWKWDKQPFINSTGVPPGAWREAPGEHRIPTFTSIAPEVAGAQKKYYPTPIPAMAPTPSSPPVSATAALPATAPKLPKPSLPIKPLAPRALGK